MSNLDLKYFNRVNINYSIRQTVPNINYSISERELSKIIVTSVFNNLKSFPLVTLLML